VGCVGCVGCVGSLKKNNKQLNLMFFREHEIYMRIQHSTALLHAHTT
jgi:hypothetical protein